MRRVILEKSPKGWLIVDGSNLKIVARTISLRVPTGGDFRQAPKILNERILMRQQFETPEDLQNEMIARMQIEKQLGVQLKKCPKYYKADWFAFRGSEFVGPVEYKRRGHSFGKFKDAVLSYDKGAALKQIVRDNDCKFMLVYEYDDGIYCCTSFEGWKVGFGGRTTNTRDSADIHPTYIIPLESFRKLNG